MTIKQNIGNFFYRIMPKAVYYNNIYRSFPHTYDGEKEPYEQGVDIEVDYDYYAIRRRATALWLKNGNVKNLIEKFNLWLVGTGLQVQMSPKESILKKKGVVIENIDTWTDDVDELFNLWAKDNHCSLNRKNNLHGIARRVNENAGHLAGDCLVICYYSKKDGVMVEVVDGGYITTPINKDAERDNIFDGVKLDSSGRPIEFYVAQNDNTWRPIKAYNSNGQEQAWMIWGAQGKLSSVRGLSSLAQTLDFAKMVTDLEESLVKNAVENANIYATVKHGVNSTGQNPMKPTVITGRTTASNEIKCDSPEEIRAKINKTSKGAVLNLGPDQEFQREGGDSIKSDSALFHKQMSDLYYSNNDLAPEVAENKFEGSYSSSRMVGKTFEFQFITKRETLLVEQLYNKVFKFWFEIMVATNVVSAPKYFTLDRIGKQAYTNKSFRGPLMPHIDPLKEINAARAILGPNFDDVPLGDLDSQIDKISNRDSTQVLASATKELEKVKHFSKENDEKEI